jgi:hypothetical protein
MTVKVQMVNNGSDSVQFINASGTIVAQVKGVDDGSSNGHVEIATLESGVLTEQVRVLSTGAISFAGAANYGAFGQTLISTGNGSPVFRGPFGLNAQLFAATGTFTIPSGVTVIKITVVGGGGGAGASSTNYGTGGGGGGCAVAYLTGMTPGNTISVAAIGAGGAGGSGGNGVAGGTTTVSSGTQSITTVSATGGAGGIFNSAGATQGAGGSGSGGTINFQGGRGTTGTGAIFGTGGSSYLGRSGGDAGGAGVAGFVLFEW